MLLSVLRCSLLLLLSITTFSCGWSGDQVGDIRPVRNREEVIDTSRLSSPDGGLYCGYRDSKGNLWFGTRGRGVFRYDSTGFVQLTLSDGLASNDISAISEDQEGHIWFGVPDGACMYDGNSFKHIPVPWTDTSSVWLDQVYPVVNPNQVMSILADDEGGIWLGTNGAGVYRYDGQSFEHYLDQCGKVYQDGLQHNIILSMTADHDCNIWFSSLSHGGVSKYDGNTFTHYISELNDDFIRVIFCDREGVIWIGTHGNNDGGVDRFDGEHFRAFHKTEDGFQHNNVKSIYQDSSGRYWMGSGTTELALFDGEHFRSFLGPEGESFTRVHFILDGPGGDIWFGGIDGLWRYDGNNTESMTRP